MKKLRGRTYYFVNISLDNFPSVQNLISNKCYNIATLPYGQVTN